MKNKFIYWASAPLLALVLALVLAIAMSAPVWAEEAGATPGGIPSAGTSATPGGTPPTGAGATPGETSSQPPASATPIPFSFSFIDSSTVRHDQQRWDLTVYLTGDGIDPATSEITWFVERQFGEPATTKLPTLEGVDANVNRVTSTAIMQGETITGMKLTAVGTTITVVDQGAGKFVIRAEYTDSKGEKHTTADKNLTVSGIVLSGTLLDTKTNTMTMVVSGSATLVATPYGDADDLNATKVIWTSSNASVVGNNGGNLLAWGVGRAVITAAKGRYSAECTVIVEEDKSVIASGYTASVSSPLKLSTVYGDLRRICRNKTAAMNNGTSAELSYITNLKVSTDQGTLYYNYSTESDTGDGVGFNDRFQYPASGSMLDAERLSFVPKKGFIGTAEITFNGVAESGQNFAGVIRIEVNDGLNSSGGSSRQISYLTLAGEAVWFSSSDFNAYCQSKYGRNYNYVTFNLPKSSEGVLYYNYVAGSGNPVTTSIQFAQSGRYTLDDVCFVPNAAYTGEVSIGFRAVDTSGNVIDGTVKVVVSAANAGPDSSNVTITGERGKPVTLLNSLFNDACRATIRDTLSYVIFKLPDQSEGTLYYNYRSDGTFDSRVSAGTRYYFSGAPGLSGVTFVPASNAVSLVAIPYTGYGAGGASFSGMLYISLNVDRTTIYYSVAKGGAVAFRAADFYNAAMYQVGVGVTYVTFSNVSSAYLGNLGTLYYNYQSSSPYHPTVSSGTLYYYSTGSRWQNQLGLISFHAGDSAVGTVKIPYTAVCGTGANQKTFTGVVEIQVGSRTPEDIRLSCNTGEYTSGWQLGMMVNSVCASVMNGNLSYIEITGVPDAKEGHLYLSYNGFGTGTAVEQGNRIYLLGSPSLYQLSFVPFARFAGEAEITYIAYSADGQEQVSGRIVVNVTKSADSLYFDDMDGDKGDYTWAADSVDYLRRNGTVYGVGDDCYEPSGIIKRGDFALMLVRAYKLTASGSASFKDVPGDEYYADAIRIVSLLGIANGYNGNFNPEEALTRQDAMVMIYNTLRVKGKTTTNGLTADLSVYHDEKQIDAYAREAMGNLVQMGVVQGDGDGYLRPQSRLNRAEAAILLHTIMTL